MASLGNRSSALRDSAESEYLYLEPDVPKMLNKLL